MQKQKTQQPIGTYEPQVLTEQHFDFIKRFYRSAPIIDNLTQKNMTSKKMKTMLSKKPVDLINILVQRFENHLKELK